jgi:membrane fusion protein (multidrug efflux system)
LLQTNAGTRVAYDQARFALETAKKQLESLQEQVQAALTRLGGDASTPVEQLPQYLVAKAQADEARRQLDHTIVRAPFAGVVTAVDHLQPGTFLVSQTAALTNTGAIGLISSQDVWIDANVKETDLTYAKIGDPVDVQVDAYPGRVWHGHVSSIAPASGAEFSILPAQNASGNWVKVVQRLPVRIALEPTSDAPLLRAGMSVVADIDTGHVRTWSELWGGARADTDANHVDRKN